MKDAEIRFDGGVTLIGGGAIGPDDLELALELAPYLVAVDGGGLGPALSCGHTLHAVVGDLDSLNAEDRARVSPDIVFPVTEQESTDFAKALRTVIAPFYLCVGFLGGRVDHQFAAFNTLVRQPDKTCLLIGETEIVLHLPRVLEIDLDAGDRVSLVPMAPVSGRSEGLNWPIDGLAMAPDGQIGTSNHALGPIRIETNGDGLLAVLPRKAVSRTLRALGSVLPR